MKGRPDWVVLGLRLSDHHVGDHGHPMTDPDVMINRLWPVIDVMKNYLGTKIVWVDDFGKGDNGNAHRAVIKDLSQEFGFQICKLNTDRTSWFPPAHRSDRLFQIIKNILE